jgi:mevalonate kinase
MLQQVATATRLTVRGVRPFSCGMGTSAVRVVESAQAIVKHMQITFSQ